ncbi:hypothetical protein, partial [Paenibacillus xerothermodurans]|uniref:hypothetical protein n=1 Tax=Paenibacillus xerothermodurans TaxID=1977292 RepID=UPI001A9F6A12
SSMVFKLFSFTKAFTWSLLNRAISAILSNQPFFHFNVWFESLHKIFYRLSRRPTSLFQATEVILYHSWGPLLNVLQPLIRSSGEKGSVRESIFLTILAILGTSLGASERNEAAVFIYGSLDVILVI